MNYDAFVLILNTELEMRLWTLRWQDEYSLLKLWWMYV